MVAGGVGVVALVVTTSACGGSGEAAGGDDESKGSGGNDGDPGVVAAEELPVTRVLRGEESFPEGFMVPAGEVWEFEQAATTTVVSEANVVVEGVLRMHPVDHDVMHTLRFEGIDESDFVGGGTEVLDSDVGLWVVGDGQLDIVGSEKAGWNRTGSDPTWRDGDDIRVAPIGEGDVNTFEEFEPGDEVPSVSHAGEEYEAEVFNLTRNVRIEGTGDGGANPATNGRAHIWINSTKSQTIRYAELRHLGPRQASESGKVTQAVHRGGWTVFGSPEETETGDGTEGVHGRYGLHLHMSGDGSRDSLIEGVVVRDTGNHAFVPHASHGVTIRDTIAFNVFEDAYWWDPDRTGPDTEAVNATNEVVIDHALAARVRSGSPRPHDGPLSGFSLGEGKDLTLTDSAAVGLQDEGSTAGFHWPASASASAHNVWEFHGNVAHNNGGDGIFVWQNDENDHVVQDFVGYHNAGFAVQHGAALNTYRYEGLLLFGNGEAGIRSVAAASGEPQEWLDIDTDGMVIAGRSVTGTRPVVFRDLTLRGTIVVDETEGNGSSIYELHDGRTGDGEPLTEDSFDIRNQRSQITVHGPDDAFEVLPAG